MRSSTKKLIAALFPLALFLPALSVLLPGSAAEIENRRLEFPEVTLESLFDVDFYREAIEFIRDSNAVRALLISAGTGIDFYLFDDSPDPSRVFKGSDDWLYLRETIDEACTTAPNTVAANLVRLIERLQLATPSVVVTVAPSKFAVHPEHLTAAQVEITKCARDASEALRNTLDASAISGYIDSWDVFATEKAMGRQPYFRTDTHFNYEASIPWMQKVLSEFDHSLDGSEITSQGSIEFEGNLMSFLGINLTETVEYIVLDRDLEQIAEPINLGSERFRTTDDNGLPTLRGRTFVIGDSFMVLPRPSLAQYFEDVSFLDWRDEADVDYFLTNAGRADRIFLEVSELDIWRLFDDTELVDRLIEAGS